MSRLAWNQSQEPADLPPEEAAGLQLEEDIHHIVQRGTDARRLVQCTTRPQAAIFSDLQATTAYRLHFAGDCVCILTDFELLSKIKFSPRRGSSGVQAYDWRLFKSLDRTASLGKAAVSLAELLQELGKHGRDSLL